MRTRADLLLDIRLAKNLRLQETFSIVIHLAGVTMRNPILRVLWRHCAFLTMCLLGLSAPTVASYDASAPMSIASNGDVDIAYRVVGDPQAEPILIIMGLSASHRVWNPQLITGLADGGYRVVLLDNRDVGESSKIEKKGRLWLAWQLMKYRIGLRVKSPYALSDMAVDAVAVLDALGIERAHVIGASMGGMIGQIVAYDFPQRTQSLVSIMSTTWAPHLPQPGRAQQDGISGNEQVRRAGLLTCKNWVFIQVRYQIRSRRY